MFIANWKDLEGWNEYRHTCVERDLWREMIPTAAERAKFVDYCSWAKVYCVPPGKTMLPHAINANEFVYVIDGQAEVEAGGIRKPITRRDAFEIPAGITRSFINGHENQSLIFLSLVARDPKQGDEGVGEVKVSDCQEDPGPKLDELHVYNWLRDRADFKLGHDETLWWCGFNGMYGEDRSALQFRGYMMCVTPVDVAMDGHMHKTGEIYFIDQGEGMVKVGDEECPVSPGTLILMPANTPHAIKSNLEGQQLNILIIATSSEILKTGSDEKNILRAATPEGDFDMKLKK